MKKLVNLVAVLGGIVVGTITAQAADLALALDGVNDYAIAPSSPSLDLGAGAGKSFTLEAFFHLPETNKQGVASIITKDGAYAVALDFKTNGLMELHFTLWSSPGPSGRSDRSTYVRLKPGRHHVAAVFANSTNGTVRTLFLDGKRAYRDDFSSFPSGIAASTSPITLAGGYVTNSFHGWLDEVRLSDTVKYADSPLRDGLVHYRIPVLPFVADSNTVALWHFDESPGATNFADASGRGNHLASVNGATTEMPPAAQKAGTLDQTFYSGLGVEDELFPNGLHALGVQTNGQIIIGGRFLRVDGMARSNLARLNPNGSVDPAFNVALTSSFGLTDVKAILVLPNNQLLIGGDFATVNGANRAGLARLNADGALDTTFDPVFTGLADTVNTIVRQPDGKLIISGTFAGQLVRLNANGTLDTSFNAGRAVFSGVRRILLQPDGKVLCHVSFYNFAQRIYTNVIRLNANGDWDASFQPTVTSPPEVTAFALQQDGKIVVAGLFDTVNGGPRKGAARLHSNGILDESFNLTNSQGSFHTNGGSLSFVGAQSDGQILLGGSFTVFPNAAIPSIARFLSNGSLDPAFEPAEFYSPEDHTVFASTTLPSGKILIAGEFTDVNGYSRRGIARLFGDRGTDLKFIATEYLTNRTVRLTLTNQPGGVYVIESSTNLLATNWLSLSTNTVAASAFNFIDTNASAYERRFYRARQLSP